MEVLSLVASLREVAAVAQDEGYRAQVWEEDALLLETQEANSITVRAEGRWRVAMILVATRQELAAPGARSRVAKLVLRLHSRFLGCRFGDESGGNLVASVDLYPDLRPEQILSRLAQLEDVAATTVELLERAVSGAEVTEDEVDEAFEWMWDE